MATRAEGSAAAIVFATVVFPEPVPPAMPTTSEVIAALNSTKARDALPYPRSYARSPLVAAPPTATIRTVMPSPPESPAPAARRAALFDMDRTLLRRESASLYVRYQREIGEATLRDLARTLYWIGRYTLGLLDPSKVVEQAMSTVRGIPE